MELACPEAMNAKNMTRFGLGLGFAMSTLVGCSSGEFETITPTSRTSPTPAASPSPSPGAKSGDAESNPDQNRTAESRNPPIGSAPVVTATTPPAPAPTPTQPPTGNFSGGSGGKTGSLVEPFSASNGQASSYKANVPADVATKTYGLHIHLHGDGGGGYTDFPNKETRNNLIGIAIKAPNAGMTWGRDEGVAHGQYVNELIEKVLLKNYNIDKDRIYFSGVSGGSYFLAGNFLPTFGAKYSAGAILMCGGEPPRVSIAQPEFLTKTKTYWLITKDERPDITASVQQATAAYKQQLTTLGVSDSTTVMPVEYYGTGGGHCAFNGLDYTSGIQHAIDTKFQLILKK